MSGLTQGVSLGSLIPPATSISDNEVDQVIAEVERDIGAPLTAGQIDRTIIDVERTMRERLLQMEPAERRVVDSRARNLLDRGRYIQQAQTIGEALRLLGLNNEGSLEEPAPPQGPVRSAEGTAAVPRQRPVSPSELLCNYGEGGRAGMCVVCNRKRCHLSSGHFHTDWRQSCICRRCDRNTSVQTMQQVLETGDRSAIRRGRQGRARSPPRVHDSRASQSSASSSRVAEMTQLPYALCDSGRHRATGMDASAVVSHTGLIRHCGVCYHRSVGAYSHNRCSSCRRYVCLECRAAGSSTREPFHCQPCAGRAFGDMGRGLTEQNDPGYVE